MTSSKTDGSPGISKEMKLQQLRNDVAANIRGKLNNEIFKLGNKEFKDLLCGNNYLPVQKVYIYLYYLLCILEKLPFVKSEGEIPFQSTKRGIFINTEIIPFLEGIKGSGSIDEKKLEWKISDYIKIGQGDEKYLKIWNSGNITHYFIDELMLGYAPNNHLWKNIIEKNIKNI